MIRHAFFALGLAVVASVPSSAQAYWPYMGYGGFGNGWGFNQATDYVPAPPYFALHPPVYYSHQITARHYGASPFAWMPGMQPITYGPLPVVKAMVIENPHATRSNTESKVAVQDDGVMKPLKIDNPFFVSAGR